MVPAQLYHLAFDVLAVALALAGGALVYRWRLRDALPAMTARIGPGYFIALALGSITGAYLFGTANLWLSGQTGIGRSILGALFGAICAVEFYKWRRGTRGSTGFVYAVRDGAHVTPITSLFPAEELVAAVPNAITFERQTDLRQKLIVLFAGGCTVAVLAESGFSMLRDMLGILILAVFGGLPLAVGVFLLLLGFRIRSKPDGENSEDSIVTNDEGEHVP